MRDPFPLQWPVGWARTPATERRESNFGRGPFRIGFGPARQGLLDELRRLRAVNAVITTDLPLRSDGVPYARQAGDGDPGVAVWFVMRDQERVFACDRWISHAENMRAIALSIEAMRGLERWGAGDVVARAFAGFNALPEGEPPARTWREVLGGSWPALERAELLAIAKARHRALITKAHPDAGGSTELAAEINAALADAERELGA